MPKDKHRSDQNRPADQVTEPIQHNHPDPVFKTDPLPPMDAAILLKHKELGGDVRMLVGGRMMTVRLTDYEADSDTYDGSGESNRKLDQETLPIVRDVHGIVFFPHPTRPDYAFQCVRCGEDESVLINIANASIADRQGGEK